MIRRHEPPELPGGIAREATAEGKGRGGRGTLDWIGRVEAVGHGVDATGRGPECRCPSVIARRRFRGALVLAALAATTLGVTVAGAGTDEASRASTSSSTTVAPPTTAVTTSTTVAAPTTTTTTLALATPELAPADPRADVPVVEIGSISIPSIGLEHPVYEGVWLTVIDRGPGHWPGTPLPGGWGNAVFGGHRVTHSHPFFDLDRLAPGDEIAFDLADGSTHVYRVTEQFVVRPEDVWIVDQAPGRTLTLFSCHPKGSARQRIVIRAELQSSTTT